MFARLLSLMPHPVFIDCCYQVSLHNFSDGQLGLIYSRIVCAFTLLCTD